MLPGEQLRLRDIFFRAVHGSASAQYSRAACDAWAPAQFDQSLWIERMDRLQPFVVDDDGVLAGFADVQDGGYIDMFFVDPAFGRSGVGQMLMAAIAERAVREGLPRLYAHVSLTAQAFFIKAGFQVAERRTVFIGTIALDNALMTRPMQSGQKDYSA